MKSRSRLVHLHADGDNTIEQHHGTRLIYKKIA